MTAVRAGWCLISSLVLAPAITLFNISTGLTSTLTRNKTLHSSSQDSKGSNTLIQLGLRCWDPRSPNLSPTGSTTGQLGGSLHVSGRERQHHSSVWRTCTNLRTVTDLPSLWTGHRPPLPPIYQPPAFHDHHRVPRGLYSRDTLVLKSVLRDSSVRNV